MKIGKRGIFSIIVLMVLISLYVFSQDLEWIPKFPIDSPSARLQMSLVYDCNKNEIIMFGGILRTSAPSMKNWPSTNEMWEWDGATWMQLTPDILPEPRRSAGMVYDSETKKIILFGGFNSPTLDPTPYEKIVYNDTWEWDGENWINVIPNGLAPPFTPDKKWGHCMVYDKTRKKTVLFGGYNAYQSPSLFDETWEYDSNTHTWTKIQLLTHPERRRYASMVFDENRGKIVLFAGLQTTKTSAFNDTWVYDGEWIELQTDNTPEPRHESRMVYNYLSGNVFIFGGYGGIVSESPLCDFWELDGLTWIQKFSADYPSERYAHGMVSDANRQEIVLYGGTTGLDALDDTWIYGVPKVDVDIDIKPGSYPNSINLGANGNVPVAIFSTEDFDAMIIDPLTVTLAGASVRIKGKGTPQTSAEDVDGDGLLDLIVHVDTTALELTGNDTEAILEGQTFDGTSIRGVDTVRIIQE